MTADTRLHRLYSRARLDDRQVNELLGLANGIIADGAVLQNESEFLQRWLVAHVEASNNPVVKLLLDRVNDVLADRHLDSEEAAYLFETLTRFSAGDFEIGEVLKSTSLPLDEPPPEIRFRGRRFCFTGTFAFGSRRQCEEEIAERGGMAGSLLKGTSYLVVGIYATESWAHSTFGRKIEKAMEMKAEGLPISIIGEQHWVAQLKQ